VLPEGREEGQFPRLPFVGAATEHGFGVKPSTRLLLMSATRRVPDGVVAMLVGKVNAVAEVPEVSVVKPGWPKTLMADIPFENGALNTNTRSLYVSATKRLPALSVPTP
jgi:hypothetical protein